jgi:hypothetical protein
MFTDLVFTQTDRFVLRFWNYTVAEYEDLLIRLAALASGKNSETRIRLSAPAFGVDRLVLRAGSKDRGGNVHASTNSIVWELDSEGWQSVYELASRVEPGSSSFRWLDDRAEVSVLLSPSGRW